MKKIAFSIVLLGLYYNVSAQKLISKNDISEQRFGKEIIYKDKKDHLLNGYFKIAESSGAYIEVHFVEGKRNGVLKGFDKKGNLIQKRAYQNGVPVDTYQTYYPNGKIKVEGRYINGKQDGLWRYYDSDGKLKEQESFKLGTKDGTFTKRYGKVEEHYKNDEPTGKWIEKTNAGKITRERIYSGKGSYTDKKFFTNGQVNHIQNYKDFKRHGYEEVYSEAGTLLKKTLYDQDQVVNISEYYDNGNLESYAQYKDGLEDGDFIEKYPNGKTRLEGAYDKGSKSGIWKQYTLNGELLVSEIGYKNNVEHGIEKVYFRNGTIEREGQNENGLKVGVWKYYNGEGKLHKTETYKNGNLVSSKIHD